MKSNFVGKTLVSSEFFLLNFLYIIVNIVQASVL